MLNKRTLITAVAIMAFGANAANADDPASKTKVAASNAKTDSKSNPSKSKSGDAKGIIIVNGKDTPGKNKSGDTKGIIIVHGKNKAQNAAGN